MLKNDTLTIENECMCRTYAWNNGNIRTISIRNKSAAFSWLLKNKEGDSFFPGENSASNAHLTVMEIAANSITPDYLQAEIITCLGSFFVKKVFRIYPDCPAFACDIYLKGSTNISWLNRVGNNGDLINIETQSAISAVVGDPAPKSQRRREQDLTLEETSLANSCTGQQLERCIAASADGGWRRGDGNDKQRPITGRQDCSKARITGQRSCHRARQYRRQDRHQVATVAVLESHERSPRSGAIRAGSPCRRQSHRARGGADLRCAPQIGRKGDFLGAGHAPGCARSAAPPTRGRQRQLEGGCQ